MFVLIIVKVPIRFVLFLYVSPYVSIRLYVPLYVLIRFVQQLRSSFKTCPSIIRSYTFRSTVAQFIQNMSINHTFSYVRCNSSAITQNHPLRAYVLIRLGKPLPGFLGFLSEAASLTHCKPRTYVLQEGPPLKFSCVLYTFSYVWEPGPMNFETNFSYVWEALARQAVAIS